VVTLGRTVKKHPGVDTGTGGFTLIELLVVIVVLGVLAGIVVFAVGNFRSDARNSACRTDVRTLQTANAAYLAKVGHDAADIDALIEGGYIKSAPESGVTFVNGETNPATVAACTGELAFTPDPSSTTSSSAPPGTPTLSVIASGSTVHPGDEGTPQFQASVVMTVTDEAHVVVEGAVVTGTWEGGIPGNCDQPTAANGTCTFTSELSADQPNVDVVWTLSAVTKTGYTQAAGPATLRCSRHNNAGGAGFCH
jgi:general secretion pathway protein G